MEFKSKQISHLQTNGAGPPVNGHSHTNGFAEDENLPANMAIQETDMDAWRSHSQQNLDP